MLGDKYSCKFDDVRLVISQTENNQCRIYVGAKGTWPYGPPTNTGPPNEQYIFESRLESLFDVSLRAC